MEGYRCLRATCSLHHETNYTASHATNTHHHKILKSQADIHTLSFMIQYEYYRREWLERYIITNCMEGTLYSGKIQNQMYQLKSTATVISTEVSR
jgi:hypothetical protein